MITRDFVINSLGGTKAVAEALSLDISTVSCWRGRGKGNGKGSIPSLHWLSLAQRAADLGVAGITLETLAELAAREARESIEARA
jgi:hypothetical protein